MTSTLNKRQQARNERTLQELIKTVPGNDKCADCGARNPGWASWSLGVFLCMRCAALHRKLGTHISKVKSLSMDSWNNEQVDNMKRNGNTVSNRRYNLQNAKPSIPIDADEVDGAMERFIRQKYEHKVFSGGDSRPGARQNTGSTSSAEDQPPPLPPKPSKRFNFGLRSASSTFPMSRSDRFSPPPSPNLGRSRGDTSPPRVSKASRVFGSNVGSANDSFEAKLTTLREMGFQDEKRNSTVLKGLNGNLDRAVESLIRLGEGSKGTSRSHTPVTPKNESVNGITVERTRPAAPPSKSTNPFDQLDAPPAPHDASSSIQSQQSHSSAYAQNATAPNPYNPFVAPAQSIPQQQQSLDQSLQNLQISQSHQQPLFPNSTGGYANHSTHQSNPYLNTYTPPPMPQIPPQYNNPYASQAGLYQQQQVFQSFQAPAQGSNPFLRSTRSQSLTPSNPFNQPPTDIPSFTQSLQTLQQFQPTTPQPQSFQPSYPTPNPIQQQPPQQQQQQQPFFNPFPDSGHQSQQPRFLQQQPSFAPSPHQPQPHSPPQQMPPRHDKSSILALYNYPHLAPPRPTDSSSTPPAPATSQAAPSPGPKQRSVTMPVVPSAASAAASASANGTQLPGPGSMNPFAASGSGQAASGAAVGLAPAVAVTGGGAGANGVRHASNESVDFAGMMGGRHSPDAFAGLSARFVR